MRWTAAEATRRRLPSCWASHGERSSIESSISELHGRERANDANVRGLRQLHLFAPTRQVNPALQILPGQQRSFFFVPQVHSQPLSRFPSQSSKLALQLV